MGYDDYIRRKNYVVEYLELVYENIIANDVEIILDRLNFINPTSILFGYDSVGKEDM